METNDHQQDQERPSNCMSLRDISKLVFPNLACLNCSTFFFELENIYDETINPAPLIAHSDISVNQQNIHTILPLICGLLNNMGGIIMMGCTQTLCGEVIPIGREIQKEQESIMTNALTEAITNNIHLRDQNYQVKTYVTMSFVPLIKREMNHGCTGYELIQTNKFVFRLCVHPQHYQDQFICSNGPTTLNYLYRSGSLYSFQGEAIYAWEISQKKKYQFSGMYRPIKRPANFLAHHPGPCTKI